MNPSGHLPLARKWRPTHFDAVVGQELTVRLLKNSLFRGSLYPVYLLAGQRGCGKTTVGRVFAAAVNCQALEAFMQKPQEVRVPCGTCASCQAMAHGNHPDFIEIDAASHTGVDNVRQIIEATSFLPQLGRKKIYLIDEAHMLSKAAFNAFLKILEEPPMSVLFMMATTDPFKIIDTVRSRCFQLFFNPIAEEVLVAYLELICKQEQIASDRDGLTLVVRATEGSVRDALNLVERIVLAEGSVTASSVRAVIGYVTDEGIVGLLEYLVMGNAAVIEYFQSHLAATPAPLVWKKLFDGVRALLLTQLGIKNPAFEPYQDRLTTMSKKIAREKLVSWLQLLFDYEQQFLKTAEQQALLETLLVKMVLADGQTKSGAIVSGNQASPSVNAMPPRASVAAQALSKEPLSQEPSVGVSVTPVATSAPQQLWQRFLQDTATLPDPVLASVLQKSSCIETDVKAKTWRIALPKEYLFFQDLLVAHVQMCAQGLQKLGGVQVALEFCFTETSANEGAEASRGLHSPALSSAKSSSRGIENVSQASGMRPRFGKNNNSKTVDVSDPEKWKTAQALLQHFPGTITEGEAS